MLREKYWGQICTFRLQIQIEPKGLISEPKKVTVVCAESDKRHQQLLLSPD